LNLQFDSMQDTLNSWPFSVNFRPIMLLTMHRILTTLRQQKEF